MDSFLMLHNSLLCAKVAIPNIYTISDSFLVTVIGQGLALFPLDCVCDLTKVICKWQR